MNKFQHAGSWAVVFLGAALNALQTAQPYLQHAPWLPHWLGHALLMTGAAWGIYTRSATTVVPVASLPQSALDLRQSVPPGPSMMSPIVASSPPAVTTYPEVNSLPAVLPLIPNDDGDLPKDV